MPPKNAPKAAPKRRATKPAADDVSVRMAGRQVATLQSMAQGITGKPLNANYCLKVTEAYAWLLSQPGLTNISTAKPYGTGQDEVSTKAFLSPEEFKLKLQRWKRVETAWNVFSLNPYWVAVNSVPFNSTNMRKLVTCLKEDPDYLNELKVTCRSEGRLLRICPCR